VTTTPIRTLLIANRGEIARRIIRTAREMGIRTIGVYSEADRLAPHVQEADVAVPIGPAPAAESYLNRTALLDAAAWQGADAIHPGYGFLSESAAFANAVAGAGLTWVGPPADAIRAMGDKIGAKHLAAEAGLPVSETVVLAGDQPAEWDAAVVGLDLPLIIKAAAGGGGRGMRVVRDRSQLAEAVRSARREAQASFGDGTVFAEPYLTGGRHIEIQVFADRHGNVIDLGERECSIQRRHQKLIEESPAPGLDAATRERMADAARRLVRSLSYEGAGTVELLLTDQLDDEGRPAFWFLEMNTRLQVEHAVTELRTGIDLVRWQLSVAAGESLPLTQDEVSGSGHAIEARVYAEDPDQEWLGSVGTLHRWQHGPTPGLRYDDAVETGITVTSHYDALLSKVVSHAPTRAEAAARLERGLRELEIHGLTTNRDYLVHVLGHDDFRAGAVTTTFVEDHPPTAFEDPETRYEREWQRFNAIIGPHLAAAALADPSRHATRNPVWPFVPTGWRNVGGSVREIRPGAKTWHLTQAPTGFASQTMAFERRGETWEISYHRVERDHPLAVRRRTEAGMPSDLFNVTINGPTGNTTQMVELIALDDDATIVHFGRRAHRCSVHVVGDMSYVNSALGQSVFRRLPRFPSAGGTDAVRSPSAPVPGRVVRVEVAVGDAVEPGQALVVLEAMKVEHTVRAATAGTVEQLLVGPGDQVEAHQVLVRVAAPGPAPDDPGGDTREDADAALATGGAR
jgi:3-methylcrotonyl-CoA carboxylase alpha subunit